MKKLMSVMGVVLVFVLGGVAGVIVGPLICPHGLYWGGPHSTQAIVRKLDRGLSLDREQKAKLEAIINDAKGEMRAVRKEVRPKIDAIIQASQDKVRAILHEDQKAKFEKLVQEWKEKQKRWEEEKDR